MESGRSKNPSQPPETRPPWASSRQGEDQPPLEIGAGVQAPFCINLQPRHRPASPDALHEPPASLDRRPPTSATVRRSVSTRHPVRHRSVPAHQLRLFLLRLPSAPLISSLFHGIVRVPAVPVSYVESQMPFHVGFISTVEINLASPMRELPGQSGCRQTCSAPPPC